MSSQTRPHASQDYSTTFGSYHIFSNAASDMRDFINARRGQTSTKQKKKKAKSQRVSLGEQPNHEQVLQNTPFANTSTSHFCPWDTKGSVSEPLHFSIHILRPELHGAGVRNSLPSSHSCFQAQPSVSLQKPQEAPRVTGGETAPPGHGDSAATLAPKPPRCPRPAGGLGPSPGKAWDTTPPQHIP